MSVVAMWATVSAWLPWNRRGIRLPQRKESALSRPVAELSSRVQVWIPVAYRGEAFGPLSKQKGDAVEYGEPIAYPRTAQGFPTFSSVTGTVVGKKRVNHPLYGELSCVLIQGEDRSNSELPVRQDIGELDADQLCEIARLAGIVDEVNGVPLYRELEDWRACEVDCLVADAVEGEPYGSASLAVLSMQARQVKEGLLLAKRACGAKAARISVRTNSARLVELKRQVGRNSVYAVRSTVYPHGSMAPKRYSRVCRVGVQACLALFRAAGYAEPQTSFVLTVAGDAVERPQNVRVPVGIPAQAALEFCGWKETSETVVFGDAMTGVSGDAHMPLYPTLTCLLALGPQGKRKERACISCGRCAQVCHKALLPYEIVRLCRASDYDAVGALHPEECDACGACSFVCPAKREVMARVLEAMYETGAVLREGDEEDG